MDESTLIGPGIGRGLIFDRLTLTNAGAVHADIRTEVAERLSGVMWTQVPGFYLFSLLGQSEISWHKRRAFDEW